MNLVIYRYLENQFVCTQLQLQKKPDFLLGY